MFNKIHKVLSTKEKVSSKKKKGAEAQQLAAELKIQELENERMSLSNRIDELEHAILSVNITVDKIKAEQDELNSQLLEKSNLFDLESQKCQNLEREIRFLKDDKEKTANKTIITTIEIMRFCDILKSIDDKTTEECISIVKNKMEQSLVEYGVRIVKEADGLFDPKCQRIVDTQETVDSLAKNHVAQVVRPGYWYEGKCLIPQDVIIFSVKG